MELGLDMQAKLTITLNCDAYCKEMLLYCLIL